MRLLVAEDDKDINNQLVKALQQDYAVDPAYDGQEAEFLGLTESYDLAILDLGLPKIDGINILKSWRREGKQMPVLILTARDSWSDKVAGIDCGADDYVTKPFHMDEVLARVRALIRRSQGLSNSQITCGEITLDTSAGTVFNKGVEVKLTSLEFRLLSYLMHHHSRIVSRSQLVEHLYDQKFDRESNTIDVIIMRLRRKLGEEFITTTRGLGYMIKNPSGKRG